MSVNVLGIDERLGRMAGELLARSRTSDVIDAALVLVAEDGDRVVTSDVGDLRTLAVAAELQVELVRC
jgi:hypothetical protein